MSVFQQGKKTTEFLIFFFFAPSFAIGDVHLPMPHSDLALVNKLDK